MSNAPPAGDDDRPLPYGWIKQWNADYAQYFYVDTKADPPRSIWVHPLEDEHYLKEHPEAREKDSSPYRPPAGPPPGASSSTANVGSSRGDEIRDRTNRNRPGEKRGFLGKIKDSVIGTKEEREAAKLREREERRRQQEARQRQMEEMQRRQQEYYQQQQQHPQQFGPPQGYYGGNPAQQGGFYAPQYAPQQQRRGGFGGGGFGMPLLGGLAGGLLLGEALDGFGGDGGGFGGDDGGGGFDGGGGDFGGD